MRKYLVLFIILIILLLVSAHTNKFEIGDCVTDDRTELIRKITDIQGLAYHYCIYKNDKCVGKRFIRIVFFDRIMKKTQCIIEESK